MGERWGECEVSKKVDGTCKRIMFNEIDWQVRVRGISGLDYWILIYV